MVERCHRIILVIAKASVEGRMVQKHLLESINDLTQYACLASLVSILSDHSRFIDDMRKKVLLKQDRSLIIRLWHAGEDKADIATWKEELALFLNIFNVRITSLYTTDLRV